MSQSPVRSRNGRINVSSSQCKIYPSLHRGCSRSVKMLTPNGAPWELPDLSGINRPTNEPGLNQSMPRGTTGQAQSVQCVAAQPQQYSQETDIRHYSFASSMDLISSTPAYATACVDPYSYQSMQSQNLHSNLFKSSSHRTSHTAAAGDLLTMSRRALDPPQLNCSPKKRSVATADATDNASQLNFIRSPSAPTQGLYNPLNPTQQQIQQHIPASHYSNPLKQNEMLIPNQSQSASSSIEWASASTDHEGMEKSHQEHRTIRRCRRSDSFEMMEDG
jgi:hypothetical protein